jgi:hypothetical protein
METARWIAEHWFDLLQTVGIVSGFAFTAHALATESEARKIGNLIALNQEHMAIWKELYARPELSRITDERAALDTKPLSHEERLFVTFLILHLSVVYRAMKAKMFVNIEGLTEDVKAFFSLPIPKTIWNTIKLSQDKDFVTFIESITNKKL